MNWYKIKERKKKKEKSRHRAAFLLCPEKCLPLPTSRRDDGYISIFILTMPRPKIGAFFIGFGAVLLLTERRKTANPLSISGLCGSIMFNPKKRGIFNEMVAKG